MQRKLETGVRTQKDIANLAKANGDDVLRRKAQYKINQYTNAYTKVCDATGLLTQAERMGVKGFRTVKQQKVFTNGVNSDIINKKSGNDMTIDKFTPCLENAKTGQLVSTSYSLVGQDELKDLKGWKFDWNDKDLSNSKIYKLTISGDNKTQGLIAISDYKRDKAVYINLVESAPHNIGKRKEYYGVGGHLYAIAAKQSVDLGYGGFIFMDAKNMELVKHYSETLGAILIGRPHPYRMVVEEEQALKLLKIYTLKGE